MNTLRIATAQFPVSAHIKRNLTYMTDLIKRAKKKRADIAHFSEACLGGYAGVEFNSWEGYDWEALNDSEQQLRELAKDLNIALVYGTNYRAAQNDIRNALVHISNEGKRVCRYDKRFCTSGDLKFYTAGKRFITFEINGFKCGLLICYDVRFPELYRAYKKRHVQILFQSFYNARKEAANIHTQIMRQSMQAHAATNYFYISGNNSSGYYQSWPSIFVLPDGTIQSSCRQHRTDLIINEISSQDRFYDASGAYRDRAVAGTLYSQ